MGQALKHGIGTNVRYVVLFCDADYIIVFCEACLEAAGIEGAAISVVKHVTRSIADRINHQFVTHDKATAHDHTSHHCYSELRLYVYIHIFPVFYLPRHSDRDRQTDRQADRHCTLLWLCYCPNSSDFNLSWIFFV